MSTTVATVRTRFERPSEWSPGAANELALTVFWGGIQNGRCLQLTMRSASDVACLPLTRADAEHLGHILRDFAEREQTDEMEKRYGGDEDARDAIVSPD